MTPEQKLAAFIREARLEGEAGVAMEQALKAALRNQQRRSAWPLWAGGAIAAAIALMLLIPRSQAPAIPQPEHRPATARVVETPAEVLSAQEQQTPTVTRRKSRKARNVREMQVVTTPFFVLDAGMVGENPSGYLMRVQVPRATMASFGLPVNQDLLDQRVDADVLLGSDGNARAIRFVRAVQ